MTSCWGLDGGQLHCGECVRDCKVPIYTHHIILVIRKAATGELVNTVNLSCGASERSILGLRLKALRAVREEVGYTYIT